MYALLKNVHVACAVLSFAGFLLRGGWMATGSSLARHRLTRVLPHVVDTVLLFSGVALLFHLSIDPLTQPWLLAKFAGLVAYVIAGMIALRYGRTLATRLFAFSLAVLIFAYIAGAALQHSPLSWLRIAA